MGNTKSCARQPFVFFKSEGYLADFFADVFFAGDFFVLFAAFFTGAEAATLTARAKRDFLRAALFG